MERIDWTDSGMHIDEGWAHLDVYRSVAREWTGSVTTVGIPIYEDDRVVVLALSCDQGNGMVFGAQLIQKASISYRTTLEQRTEVA